MKSFINAQHAFEEIYLSLNRQGLKVNNTKLFYNYGFYINNPLDNEINSEFRNWNKDYAEYEWQWYLSGNPKVTEIKKRAKLWDTMHNGDDIVNSNYGYQWGRGKQIQFICKELRRDKYSRRAVITIYDGKENHLHKHDTPCTLNLMFYIHNNELCMNVMMRSNDLWFGFCNDQYCFSKVQELIALELNMKIGSYYHFANNIHIYKKHWDKKWP